MPMPIYKNEFYCLSVLCAFLNGWTDFDEFFCVCLPGFLDDLYSQLDPVGPTRIDFEIYDGRFLLINGCYL